MSDFKEFIQGIPGGENLSWSFCNRPVRVEQSWNDEPMAAILLCGRLADHFGDCDPTPPMGDVNKGGA